MDNLYKILTTFKEPKRAYEGFVPRLPVNPSNILSWAMTRQLHDVDTYHNRYVLIFNLYGKGSVIVDHTYHHLPAGEAILIFPQQFHHYADLTEGGHLWFFITFGEAEDESLNSLRNRTWKITDICREHLRGFAAAYRNRQDVIAQNEMQFRLGLILCEALRKAGRTRRKKKSNLNASQEVVQSAARYVHEHIDDAFGVGDVARAIGLSESRLRTVFREATGSSLGRFIRNSRLRRAQSMLITTEMGITEISRACGYESVYSFSQGSRGTQIFHPASTGSAPGERAASE